MNYLTFENNGIPIAKVYSLNGKGKGKIISLAETKEEDPRDKKKSKKKKCCKKCKLDKCKGGCCDNCCCQESDSDSSNDSSSDSSLSEGEIELLDTKYFRGAKLPYRYNIGKFKQNLKNKTVNKKLLSSAKEYIKEKKNKEIVIHDGEVQPIPRYDSRECIYIAGPSGSGKSTYIANYAKEYSKMFPQNKIYVFSRVDHDDCIDKLNPIRIIINDELIEDPISPSELANSLVIFDDTDTIPNKKLKEAVNSLKNDLLETGRHEDVHVAVSSHLINNYRDTRTVLNEAHCITLFPAGGSSYSIKYLLKNYGGMDVSDVQKTISLPSRWITLKKNYPQCILYSKGAFLLGK